MMMVKFCFSPFNKVIIIVFCFCFLSSGKPISSVRSFIRDDKVKIFLRKKLQTGMWHLSIWLESETKKSWLLSCYGLRWNLNPLMNRNSSGVWNFCLLIYFSMEKKMLLFSFSFIVTEIIINFLFLLL